ncbi:hypothetical protein [Variovorax sp. KK3]|nr:hypothetical protein [Variovorax sp. KK3]
MAIVQLMEIEEDVIGLSLPEELLARQNWGVGDPIALTEVDNGYRLSSPGKELEDQMQAGCTNLHENGSATQMESNRDNDVRR